MLPLAVFDWTIVGFIVVVFIVSIPLLGDDNGEDEELRS